MPAQNKTLADILLANHAITAEQAEKIKSESLSSGKDHETIAKSLQLANEVAIAKAKAELSNVPFIDLGERAISPEILNTIPEPVARRYTVIPFEHKPSDNLLSVAMADPLDLQVIEFLEQKSGKRIKPFMGLESQIKSAIDLHYTHSLGAEVSAALKETTGSAVKTIKAERLGEIIREAPIAKIVSTLLEFAIRNKASDIHIEPQETRTRVRYRIDGILHEKLALPRSVHDAVVSRIKILSNMKIDEKRVPQDGRFNYQLGEDEVDLRVSTLPTVFGEKIVMRLLKKTGGIPSLNDLGLRGVALKNLEQVITRPHGIVLMTGPTGSGKTTTLYSILSKLNTTRVNIVTLEDPVEYQIPGINQVQINPQAGLTFANGLRSFLRQDPNIILVGEVRDNETAELAIQAALTGHLVFSTLHTNNAAGAIPRLLDMGVEGFLVSSALNAVAAQRIVRKICPTCKTQYAAEAKIIQDIQKVLGPLAPQNLQSGQVQLSKGRGCSSCTDTGYIGRIGIFEVLPISDTVRKLVVERATSTDIEKQARAEGMITLLQDGYLKVLEGITTIEEVLRVAED